MERKKEYVPLRTAYSQDSCYGMQPKARQSSRAGAAKTRTETCELVEEQQKLLDIREKRERESVQGTNSDNAVRRTKGQHGHLDGSFQTEDQKPSPFPFRLFIRPISSEELINLIQEKDGKRFLDGNHLGRDEKVEKAVITEFNALDAEKYGNFEAREQLR
ncbi:hypothetical protein TNCV_2425151 [Trichonephila clavipes]|nr:hypothetical protein TNCV_2425151 [Trichonephila clavipes]